MIRKRVVSLRGAAIPEIPDWPFLQLRSLFILQLFIEVFDFRPIA